MLDIVSIDRSEVVVCECDDPEHQFRFRTFNWDQEPVPELYLDVHLSALGVGFWGRLWRGLRYAFGYRSRYGDWDGAVVTVEAAGRLRALLDEFLRVRNANEAMGYRRSTED